jgi:hypothetical protein
MANNVSVNTTWDMSVGGLSSDDDQNDAAKTGILPPRGVFAAVPGSTPKYAKNVGEQETDFRETMARMFLPVVNYDEFVGSFAGSDTEQLARIIGGQVSEKDGTSGGSGYIDFLLQNVQHAFQEKSQIVETLADDHVAYFFGQAAPVFTYSGTLINTKQDDQAMNMLRLYRDLGRGTKLAARNTLISIRYDGLIISGAMMNLTFTLNAEMETAVPFSFSLLVKDTLLLPQEYGGLVPLQTPFASGKNNKYLPFSTGATDISTAYVRPATIPSEAPVPVASVKTEPVKKQPPDIRPILHGLEEPNKSKGAQPSTSQPAANTPQTSGSGFSLPRINFTWF